MATKKSLYLKRQTLTKVDAQFRPSFVKHEKNYQFTVNV
jgi:hypothetical protein